MNAVTTILHADWAERVGLTLLHSLWQIAAIVGAYAIVSLLLRNRLANVRYLLGCVAMLAMLGLPIGTYVLLHESAPATTAASPAPAVAMPVLAAAEPSTETPLRPAAAPMEISAADASSPIAATDPTSSEVVAAPAEVVPAEPVTADFRSSVRRRLPWLTAAWLAGVLLLSFRPLWGWLHVRRLQRRGLSPLPDPLQQLATRMLHRLGVRRAVRFAQSARVEVPTIAGYLRPMVLLPATAITGLSATQLELILAHELAHVRRHDCLVNLAQTVIEALLFYHPGMWWISGQIRKQRENCCDDIAVAVGGNRANYVHALARLEEQRSAPAVTALAATGGSLLTRVRRLLGKPTHEFGYGSAAAWLAGLVGVGLVAAVLAMNRPAEATAHEETVADSAGDSAEESEPPAVETVPDPDFNPLSLDDETLINLFRTGSVLRRVAFDCESYYRDHDRLPADVPEMAMRYEPRSRDNIGKDPFAPGKRLRLVLDPRDDRLVQVWSVGPDGDWDGGREIDSTSAEPLDGDVGVQILVGNTDWRWLADDTICDRLTGKRLAHYLAAKGPKFPQPELKDDGLSWGPVVDGLQLAVELKGGKFVYHLGETIDLRFHIRNAADYAIQVGLTVPMKQGLGDRSVFIYDAQGQRLKGDSTWMSGTVGTKQVTLKPGESASYESSDLAFVAAGKRPGVGAVGHWVEAKPGVHVVEFKQGFPTGIGSHPRQWNGALQTAPIVVQIAEQPKFAVHRVIAYRKPGSRPGTTVTTRFRDSGNSERFDSMKPDRYPLEDLVLDGTPIIADGDVIAYDWRRHVIRLEPAAYERFAKAVKPSVRGVPFVVQSGGQPVYLGAFWTGASSYMADMPTISLDRFGEALPENDPHHLPAGAIRIENTRVLQAGELPTDPRQNGRLYRALQAAGKLLDLRSGEPPWGDPVKEVQSRLQAGVFRNGVQRLSFDLRNGSQDLSVELAPGGLPPEILIDNVPYRWAGRIAGAMPVCKPGQHVAGAHLALDENWTAIKSVSGPKTLQLKPGKHTVQAIVYAAAKDAEDSGQKTRVLSNPVEFDVAAEPTGPGDGP